MEDRLVSTKSRASVNLDEMMRLINQENETWFFGAVVVGGWRIKSAAMMDMRFIPFLFNLFCEYGKIQFCLRGSEYAYCIPLKKSWIPDKRGVLVITINYVQCWGFSSTDLGSMA